MKPLANRLLAVLLFLGAAPLSGCLAAAAGAGAAVGMHLTSNVEGEVEATPKEVVRAAERALESMDLPVTESNATGLDGVVRSETAEDKDVLIKVKSVSEGISHLSVRVGKFANEGQAQVIYDAIRDRL